MMAPVTVPTILTIGHSNHTAEAFLALLGRHRIQQVADVRSFPYSRWAPHFRKNPLARSLKRTGVDYVFLGEALGGRPADEGCYDVDGRVDYALRARAADFRAGIERLLVLACERRTVILCAEEDPARCHRRLLITPALLDRGVTVWHIRGDARLQAEATEGGLDGQLELLS